MIHIERRIGPPPKVLADDSSFVRRSLAAAEAFYSRSSRSRRQRRFEISLQPVQGPVTDALVRLFHGKCAYCESLLQLRERSDIDHYRPRRNTLGQDGETYLDHYWWLAFKWDNLFSACPECVRMKGSRFPIVGPRAEILAEAGSLAEEGPLLLNPCGDWPEDHLQFRPDGEVGPINNSLRGKTTIDMLGLNRAPLVKQRADVANEMRIAISRAGAPTVAKMRGFLEKHLALKAPYLGVRRTLVRQWLETQLPSSNLLPLKDRLLQFSVSPSWAPWLQRPLKIPKQIVVEKSVPDAPIWKENRDYFARHRGIERVEIQNFKGIANLMIELPRASSSGEPWMMFLGENGTGKSSVLQAIALALLGQAECDRLGLDGRDFVRRKQHVGRVRVWLSDSDKPTELEFLATRKRFHVTPAEQTLLLMGFGATRLLPRFRHKPRVPRRIRVKNLFDPFTRLNHAERWLMDRKAVNDNLFSRIAVSLKRLLMLPEDREFNRDAKGVWVRTHDQPVTLTQLSDGYQSVVVMAINIIMGVVQRWKEVELAEGVVLVDELEVHLHPVWKMKIVSLLRRVFPKLTFMVTTHDPLCLRGLNPGEIVVLNRDSESVESPVVATVVNESIAHLRADQLLTSPLFGLLGTREPAAASRIRDLGREYDELFAKESRTPGEESRLLELRAQIIEQTPAGESPRSRLVEKAVRQAVRQLAEETAPIATAVTPLTAPETVKAAIREKVAELLGETAS